MIAVLMVATSAQDPSTFLNRGYQASFDFSRQPKNRGCILEMMDKLLFLDTSSYLQNPTPSRILDVLMARDNHKAMYDQSSNPTFKELMPRAMGYMDASQQAAMTTLSGRMFSIIDGPQGSGKTMLAAAFGTLSIQSGEKVVFLAKTKSALKELFFQAIEAADRQQLPLSMTKGFCLFENTEQLSVEGQNLEQVYSKIESNDRCKISNIIKNMPRISPPAKNKFDTLTALFTTYDELDCISGQDFGATLLISDEAESLHGHSIFAACGLYVSTLKKVALFGNSSRALEKPESRNLNHLRNQFGLTAFQRLLCTGIEPLRLDTQYHMDPQISALPSRHLASVIKGFKDAMPLAFDDKLTRTFPQRLLMRQWVARYLNKGIEDGKVSVFADVKDGVCLQDRSGFTKINHQNMVAILHILESMIKLRLPRENIIVVTFCPEAVTVMREFFKSQHLVDIRIQHIDSENIKCPNNISMKDNLIAIIDCPFTGYPKRGEDWDVVRADSGVAQMLSPLFHVQRLVSALCIPRALRVFVGNSAVLTSNTGPTWPQSDGYKLIKDLVASHTSDGQVKNVEIGDEVLQYKKILRPQDYVLSSDTNRSAQELYQKPVELQNDQNIPHMPHPTEHFMGAGAGTGEAGIPWRSRTVAAASAATGPVVGGTRAGTWRRGQGLGLDTNGVEQVLEGRWRQNTSNTAPQRDISSRQATDNDSKTERIRNTNWKTSL
jgi:hypothetical protein